MHDFKRKFRSSFLLPSNAAICSHSLRLLFMLYVLRCCYIFFKIMMEPTFGNILMQAYSLLDSKECL